MNEKNNHLWLEEYFGMYRETIFTPSQKAVLSIKLVQNVHFHIIISRNKIYRLEFYTFYLKHIGYYFNNGFGLK